VRKTFEQWIVIAAAPGELFALTQDYGRRLEWYLFLKSAELLGGAKEVQPGQTRVSFRYHLWARLAGYHGSSHPSWSGSSHETHGSGLSH
jgi:hypothetical protein